MKSAHVLLDTIEQIDGEESASAADDRIDFAEELRYVVVSPWGVTIAGGLFPMHAHK